MAEEVQEKPGDGIVERISGAEERFDLARRRLGMVLVPLAATGTWLLPLGLDPPAHRLAAILAAVVAAWITEVVPMTVTAFLGVSATVVLGVAPAAQAFAPFADPLIFLFVGTFLLARAIFEHGLDRRFAFTILGLPGVGRSMPRVLAAFAGVSALLSMWISNTATAAMMFPIGLALLATLEEAGDTRHLPDRFPAALLLSAAFGASIGGLATPVGTPPNLIGLGFLRRAVDTEIPFFSWMLLGLPVVAILWVWCVFDLGRQGRGGGTDGLSDYVATQRRALGAWSRGEKNALFAFGMTVTLWVTPGVLALTVGQQHEWYRAFTATFPEGVSALLGAGLLFLLPLDLRRHRFTLSWEQAVQIEWWIVFLYGGGMALGTLAFETGLAEALGRGLTGMLGVRSAFGLLLLATLLATILSETTSNTAAATMVVPVTIAFAREAGVDPVLPAVGATLGASLGFMLPVSTPTNAIVYGSGRVPLRAMMRHGILLDVVGVAIIVVTVQLLGPWALGRPTP